MRSTLFEILSATAFVAAEACIAAATVSWLALFPFLDFATLKLATPIIGGVIALVVAVLFYRHALRIAAAGD